MQEPEFYYDIAFNLEASLDRCVTVWWVCAEM